MNRSTQPQCSRRRLPAFLGQVLAWTALLAACGQLVRAAEDPAPTVKLVIDYGDGAQLHLTRIAWRTGMKAIDTLAAAKSHPHGVSYAARGSGSTTLVTRIGDLSNEGNGRNWLFSVNGTRSEVGAGARDVRPGDVVLWKFDSYD